MGKGAGLGPSTKGSGNRLSSYGIRDFVRRNDLERKLRVLDELVRLCATQRLQLVPEFGKPFVRIVISGLCIRQMFPDQFELSPELFKIARKPRQVLQDLLRLLFDVHAL